MQDSRKGELLWKEWTGEGYEPYLDGSVVFFTEEHVDLENELIRRALASALQRDGISVSLGDGFKIIDDATISHGHAGEVDTALDLTVCDDEGETREGDLVDDIFEITWVEVPR